jgi:hypothetical protein
MGTVLVLAEARRAPRNERPAAPPGSASVVILPVIRIERGDAGWSSPASDDTRPRPSRGKRRRRATQPS